MLGPGIQMRHLSGRLFLKPASGWALHAIAEPSSGGFLFFVSLVRSTKSTDTKETETRGSGKLAALLAADWLSIPAGCNTRGKGEQPVRGISLLLTSDLRRPSWFTAPNTQGIFRFKKNLQRYNCTTGLPRWYLFFVQVISYHRTIGTCNGTAWHEQRRTWHDIREYKQIFLP
jgi:hypothetical protein